MKNIFFPCIKSPDFICLFLYSLNLLIWWLKLQFKVTGHQRKHVLNISSGFLLAALVVIIWYNRFLTDVGFKKNSKWNIERFLGNPDYFV